MALLVDFGELGPDLCVIPVLEKVLVECLDVLSGAELGLFIGESNLRGAEVTEILGLEIARQLLGLSLEADLVADLCVVPVEVFVLADALREGLAKTLVRLLRRDGGGLG